MSKTTNRVIEIAEMEDSKINLQETISINRIFKNKDFPINKSYNYKEVLNFLKTITIEELKNFFIDMKNHYDSDDIAMLKAVILTGWQIMMEDVGKVYVLKVIKVNKIIHFIKEFKNFHSLGLKEAKTIVDSIGTSNPLIFHISDDHIEVIKAYERIKDYAECRIIKEDKKIDISDKLKEGKKEKTFIEELEEMP